MPQTLQWTVLPNGVSNGRARFSLFVTPRLSGAPTLGSFTDWQNWPQAAANLQFTLHIGAQTFTNAQLTRIAPPSAAQLSPVETLNWWKTLFPASTLVKNGAPEKFNTLPIISFPLANLASAMKTTYAVAGLWQLQGGLSLDQCGALAKMGQIGSRGRLQLALKRFGGGALTKQGGGRAPISSRLPDPAGDMALLRLFNGDLTRETPKPTRPTQPRAARPGLQMEGDDPDFHQKLSLLGEYPAMMRAFGVVLDFEVPAPKVADGAPVWVDVAGTFAMAPTHVAPHTVVGTNFRPKARPVVGDVTQPAVVEWDKNGILRLGESLFTVVPFDVEGGVTKLEAFLRNAMQALEFKAPDTPDRSATPSLRNAGMAVARTNRAAALAQNLDNAASNIDSATPPDLHLDDLIQGFRVDVREVPEPVAPAAALGATTGLTPGVMTIPEFSKVQPMLPQLGVLKGNLTPLKRQSIRRAPGLRPEIRSNQDVKPIAGGIRAKEINPNILAIPKGNVLEPVKEFPVVVDPSEPLDNGPAWNSLCRRRGQYQIGAKTITLEDEGWVSPAVGQKQLGTQNALSLHEALFRWNDWSLVIAAPEPPKLPSAPKSQGAPASPASPNPPGWALKADFALTGTLPTLRYGHTYQFRARGVDLAGNSYDATALGGEHTETEQGYYARFEPVNSPLLVPRRDLTAKTKTGVAFDPLTANAGEANDRLVVRSDFGKAVSLNSERHVVPPRADFTIAKAHGLFDKDGKPDPAAAPLIAKLGGVLPDVVPGTSLDLPYLSEPLSRSAAMLSDVFLRIGAVPATKPWFTVPFQSGDEVTTAKPFLLRLASVGDGNAPVVKDDTGGATRSFTLALSPGQMVKMRLSSVLGASDLDLMAIWRWLEDTFDQAAIPAADKAKWKAFYETFALAGFHDMLTPGRIITFVHAVQRPLLVPKFAQLKQQRREGETGADFTGALGCDAKTSAKVDVWARWSEPVDDASTATPDTTRLSRETIAFDFPLHFHALQDPTAPGNDVPLAPPETHLIAWATDHVPVDIDALLKANANPSPTMSQIDLRIAAGAFSPAKHALYFNIQDAPELRRFLRAPRHEFGDTKYRRVTYNGVATSRFREYFVGVRPDNSRIEPVVTRGDGDEKAPITVDIPSSARPALPKIHSVIPTFNWQRSAGKSQRNGGFRVYLERPWWSSGDGEMLAVVLPPLPKLTGPADDKTVTKTPDALASRYCTRWARDPIWTLDSNVWAPETVSELRPDMFPLAKTGNTISVIANSDIVPNNRIKALDSATNQAQAGGLLKPGLNPLTKIPAQRFPSFLNGPSDSSGFELEETDELRVAIAPHEVAFDAARNQWYCDIDIKLPDDAYFPFVRFALARYQPNSLTDLELSRVALADFSQLTPNRTASVVRNGPSVRLTISGVSGMENVITARFEKRVGNDDTLGWVAQGQPVELGVTRGTLTTWSSDLPLPTPSPTPGDWRLAIREYELWDGDNEQVRRLVYAENLGI